MLEGACHSVVDAAPAPTEPTYAFPDSTDEIWRSLSVSGLDDDARFSPNLGCFVIRWAEKIILCDAGIGPGPNAYLGGIGGQLPSALAALGIAPDDVDALIFTHLHMDHIGWASESAANGQRRATFQNATYFVAADELDYWAGGASNAKEHHHQAFETILRPLTGSERLRPLAYNEPILPGITLLATPGHTPGHASIRFTRGDERLVIAGDIFHCPGQVERPDWCHRADMDPQGATATRRAFIKQAASEDWLVAAGHFRNGLQFGTIASQGDGHRFVPVDSAVVAKSIIHQGRLS
jgi:glyoxylase-like metal-dependent hydrolase (beta-lactamase superfamily II)